MDKTLETLTLLHRLILGVALALFIVGVSGYRPNELYDSAESELTTLEDAITTVADHVNHSYEVIYGQSNLEASTIAWLAKRGVVERKININVISKGDLGIPDSRDDPLVTLDTQLQWANRIYRTLEDPPLLLCVVDRTQVFHALDKMFGRSDKPVVRQLNVYLQSSHSSQTGADVGHQFKCSIELQYEVQLGKLTGLRTANMDLPTTVVDVRDPTDAESAADTLKGEGLGDWEDIHAVGVFALRDLWTEIGNQSPEAAAAFLKQKRLDESEKSKEKIDILGESLSRSLTIVMASLVELCLMVYLLAHLVQVRRILPRHETTVSESPFFGIMRSWLGQLVMLLSFLIPLGVCAFVLVRSFPSLRTDWSGPQWMVGPTARWAVVASIGITDALLILEIIRIVASLGHPRKRAT
jgi:hypothetical protein